MLESSTTFQWQSEIRLPRGVDDTRVQSRFSLTPFIVTPGNKDAGYAGTYPSTSAESAAVLVLCVFFIVSPENWGTGSCLVELQAGVSCSICNSTFRSLCTCGLISSWLQVSIGIFPVLPPTVSTTVVAKMSHRLDRSRHGMRMYGKEGGYKGYSGQSAVDPLMSEEMLVDAPGWSDNEDVRNACGLCYDWLCGMFIALIFCFRGVQMW